MKVAIEMGHAYTPVLIGGFHISWQRDPYPSTVTFDITWERERWWDHDVQDLVVVER